MHCKKETIPKIQNKYSQKRNFAATVPISTFMWVLYIFPRSICLFCCRKYVDRFWEYIIADRYINMEIRTEAMQFPEKEYINGIFLAVWLLVAQCWKHQYIYKKPRLAKYGQFTWCRGDVLSQIHWAQGPVPLIRDCKTLIIRGVGFVTFLHPKPLTDCCRTCKKNWAGSRDMRDEDTRGSSREYR